MDFGYENKKSRKQNKTKQWKSELRPIECMYSPNAPCDKYICFLSLSLVILCQRLFSYLENLTTICVLYSPLVLARLFRVLLSHLPERERAKKKKKKRKTELFINYNVRHIYCHIAYNLTIFFHSRILYNLR